jgi:sortase A
MKSLNKKKLISASIFLVGFILVVSASYIQLKAKLAQVLIASAYTQQLITNSPQRPWPWADTTVLAKLEIGDNTHYILADASMRNLAFGPAHMSQTSALGEQGNSVIIGHRDTHFSHLQHIKVGQPIFVQQVGKNTEYRVEEIAIVDASEVSVLDNLPLSALTLITCYPFNDINPNPKQRFVVRATKVI